MNLPTYQPRERFEPVNVGGMFMQAFQQARETALMEREQQGRELARQQQEEDRRWNRENIRPLQLEGQRLQLESDRLHVESQKEGLAELRRKASAQNAGLALQSSIGGMVDEALTFAGTSWQLPAAPSTGSAIGKVTSYGYANDETPDSNSAAGIGAFVSDEEAAEIRAGKNTPNRLKAGDLAVSPDIRAQFEAQGIKPGESVTVTYADGKKHTGRYMDHTADEWEGKKLTGRFDIYSPDGKHPTDGAPITGFSKGDGKTVDRTDLSQPNFANQLKAYEQINALLKNPVVANNPNGPNAIRLGTAKLLMESDKFFQEAYKSHMQEQQRRTVASGVGLAFAAANPQAAEEFKSTYTQWAGLKLNPDDKGGYHPTKADGTQLSTAELAALQTSWSGFIDKWKPTPQAYRPTADQVKALAAYQSAKATADASPKDTTLMAKAEGAKAALGAYAMADARFRPIVERALTPPPSAQASTAAAAATPTAAQPLSLDSIPGIDGDDKQAESSAQWSEYKDQLAEHIGHSYQPPAKDGKVEPPTRLMPELEPATVRATLAKKSGLSTREVALVSTLRKAKAILTDEPVKTGKMTWSPATQSNVQEPETLPASVFYAKGLPSATIDGKEVSAADGLKAWAEEVLTRAGIELGKGGKQSAQALTPEQQAAFDKLNTTIKGK